MPELTPELRAEAIRCASIFTVASEIHPDDFIFWYIHDGKGVADKLQVVQEYFQSGKDTLNFFLSLYGEHRVQEILKLRMNLDKPVSILEFASGYGRVSRHFPVMLPEVRMVACDVHAHAVQFLRSINIEAAQASHDPDSFALGETFDVIFAYSFFTHMPRSTWTKWLRALAAHLNPNGMLIFTAHGEVSQVLMGVNKIEDDGFFFHSVSEQKDLPLEEYGNTVTTFEFVSREAHTVPRLKLIEYRQCGAGHHDVYIFHNDPKAIDYDPARGSGPLSQSGSIPSWNIQELAQKVDRLSVENARLEASVNSFYASTSWKLTQPMRSIAKFFGR